MAVTSSLKVRIASALVLVPVAVAAAWAGGWVFVGLCLLAGMVMAWEWACLFAAMDGRDRGAAVIRLLIAWLGLFAALSAIAAFEAPLMLVWVWAGGLTGAMMLVMATSLPLGAAGGVFYTGLPIAALVLMRNDPVYGLAGIGWLFAVVWSTDIAAYFAGKAIGGPKLSPRWSPNKTWAGLAGGVVGAALAGLVTGLLLGTTNLLILSALSGAMAIIAQIGDIFESALKRLAGVKDSSRAIPGHGGVMDRLDGLVSAAVAVAVIGAIRNGADIAAGILIW